MEILENPFLADFFAIIEAMSKKDTEITVKDTADGVELQVGKRIIGSVHEVGGAFEARSGEKLLASFKNYADAEEEVVRHYNLSL